MAILSYADLQDRVLRWIDEPDDTSTTLNLVKDAINASHRRLLSSRQWPFLAWPRTESITTTSGTRIYALNPNVDRIYHFWDTTIEQFVPVIPRREWPAVGANQSSIAVAPYGIMWGPIWPVSAQPASASTISIVSTSASDTAVTVIITGINSSNLIVSETITATGVTTATGSTSFLQILNLTKTGTWVGTLTVSAGATTLVTLTSSEVGRLYPTVEFVEDPLTGRTLQYRFQRQPRTLTQDNDIPETPYPYSEIHVYDALLDMTTYNTELGNKEQGLWSKRYEDLYNGLLQSTDEAIVGSHPRFVRDLDEHGWGGRIGAISNP